MDPLTEPVPDPIPSIAPNDLWNLVRKRQARLIDVRTQGEYARAHIRSTQNIPLARLDPAVVVNDETLPIYLICRGGARSREAFNRLRAASPTQHFAVVDGGMLAWEDAHLPIVRSRPGRFWRWGRNVALTTVAISILLALFVNKALIGISGLVGAIVVAVMMFDRRRWWLVTDDDVTQASPG